MFLQTFSRTALSLLFYLFFVCMSTDMENKGYYKFLIMHTFG